MHIILNNDWEFHGESCEEIVQKLKDSTIFCSQSLEEYMLGAIERCSIFNGDRQVLISRENLTPEIFLKTLDEAKILKFIKEG